MSEWCASCHSGFIMNGYTPGMGGLRDPAGNNAELPAAIITNYNSYVTSGVMTNATYSTITPFEIGTSDVTVLKPRANLGAAARSARTGNNVMCLSCHRAHVSGFGSILQQVPREGLALEPQLRTVPPGCGARPANNSLEVRPPEESSGDLGEQT